MHAHPIYCENCEQIACALRTHLPTYNIVLHPGYSASRLHVHRRREHCCISTVDLKITEQAEYKARPLPHGGLDMIRNHYNDSMLSDRADFHFHEHDFEVWDKIPFDDENTKCGVKFYIPEETQAFIGDAATLIKRRRSTQPKPLFRIESAPYFNRIYRNEEHLGFGIFQPLYAYNVVDEVMYPDEGFFHMHIIKYTDKATRKADGILFGGMQNENWMNYLDGIAMETAECKGCRGLNQE